jgi:NAD(P)-dependent dehydrogenase (short-subunit alcohol dehydrogenase family)
MGAQFSQFFPPRPSFKLENLPSQKGKVFLVTGSASGIGFKIAETLYAKGGKVYIAGRSPQKAQEAIEAIQRAVPQSEGALEFLLLVLDDLSTIKDTVDAFGSKESKLDVLFNNAGVSQPPLGSVSKQGVELQLATNCLGPFLLTKMLQPLLAAAVPDAAAGTVRVVWSSSQVAELSSPPEGMIMSELTTPPKDNVRNYMNSKLGNWFLSVELARRYGSEPGIVSVAQNPGAANTNLLRDAKWMKILSWPLLHSAELAAHTVLYAGLSDDLGLANNGAYVIPWGRIHQEVAPNLVTAMTLNEEGGSGLAKEFWEFCDEKTKDYC